MCVLGLRAAVLVKHHGAAQTSFDEQQTLWRNLHEELEGLQIRLGELEEAGVDDGPVFEKVHGRFIEVAYELGLLH